MTCRDHQGGGACPWISCRWHLLIDHKRETAKLSSHIGGGIVRKRWGVDPDIAAESLAAYDGPTCALAAAGEGSRTLEEVAALLGVTRERVRQIEAVALDRLKRRHGVELGELHEAAEAIRSTPDSPLAGAIGEGRRHEEDSVRDARARYEARHREERRAANVERMRRRRAVERDRRAEVGRGR